MLIDTHCHLNFEVFRDNWRGVADEAVRTGVEKMIVVGTDLDSSKRAVELANGYEALYAAVGIHPHHAREFLISNNQLSNNVQLFNEELDKQIQYLYMLAKDPKVVAIGEVGLDKHLYRNSKHQMTNDKQELDTLFRIQKELLVKQVELAISVDKPLIIHSREVGDEVLWIMTKFKAQNPKPVRGVFHCFEGSKRYAKQVLDAGFYISFTGNITYAHDRVEVARTIPLERLLLETDSPYMLPEPLRSDSNNRSLSEEEPAADIMPAVEKGNKRLVNAPANVKIVASYHARSRNIQLNKVIEQTSRNARALFGF